MPTTRAAAAIGFIGAGAIPQAIVARLLASGIDDIVLSNSRGPASLEALAGRLGGSVRGGTAEEAAAAAIVFASVPWSQLPIALGQVPNWAGRILVDTNNALEPPTFAAADLGGHTSSELVEGLAPGAHVVKAFNHLNPAVLVGDPRAHGGKRVLFYSGDDAVAKAAIAGLIRRLGFEGIDLGGLASGGALHQFPGGPLPTRNLIQI